MASLLPALDYFMSIVYTKENLKQVLEQASKTNRKFPLKGIEHVFIKKHGETYCRYCGYNVGNLMHVTKKIE